MLLVPRSLALPLFHALTGCDTTSAFLGYGKRSAWAAWEATPELTETLVAITLEPEQMKLDVHVKRLERMVVIMYSKSCGSSRVDEAGFFQMVPSPLRTCLPPKLH